MIMTLKNIPNPITKGLTEGMEGAATGSALGLIGGKVVQKVDGVKLKNLNELKKLRKLETNYYKNYNQNQTITHKELGNITFTQAGLETVSKRVHAGKDFDTLLKDIKKQNMCEPKHPNIKGKIK